MLHTRMTTLAFILSALFPLDGFRCNFVSAPQLENCFEYNHDTSQLYRTDHDDVSRTRMTSLILYFLSYLPLMVKATTPSVLNTVRNIFMRLYGSVGEVVTTVLVFIPPPPPPPK